MTEPVIIGVRHHSPACARLVAHKIRSLQPAHVLIEGPADFNDKLGQMALPHKLPLAIYSFLSSEAGHRASWSPFAEHSPEWQALSVGSETGAQVRFIDLPAWDDAFADVLNRYADVGDEAEAERAATYEDALRRKMAVDSRDALWDTLFEQQDSLEQLEQSLSAHFEHLRANDAGSIGNQSRERMMARWIAWAMARKEGPVLVVCGGYHAPALQRAWRSEDGAHPPGLPAPDNAAGEVRFGSYLVPYTFKRLDSFTGYASGMPSPFFYQLAWEEGMQGVGPALLQRVTQRLRNKKLAASTADLIAAHTRADALARLRGHAPPARCDWLDALAGSLVKDALDAPLPWTYRGPLRFGTDPILVEIMDVLAGDVAGKLAPGTPQPPLVLAVEAELEARGIKLPCDMVLDLFAPADREKSRVLHRLLLLDIPGIDRRSGPGLAMSGERREEWALRTPLEQRAALIEAAAYGATLEDAARMKLEERMRAAGRANGESRFAQLAEVLNKAAFAGLASMSDGILAELEMAVGGEPHFESFGTALPVLHSLLLHGQSLDMAGAPILRTVIAAAFDRALWLLEAMGMVPAVDHRLHIQGFLALRQVARDALAGDAALPLQIEPERALAVWRRKLADQRSAPVSRGAALGGLVSLNAGGSAATGEATLQALALLGEIPPGLVGDALAGMLALARDELVHDAHFVAALDALVKSLDDLDFVLALPAMRNAFGWLPPQERGSLAEAVLAQHNAGHLPRRALTAHFAGADAEDLAKAALLEQAALRKLASWGLVS
ncbi:DUF5682 family protein [Duganella sp. Root198D2]|uniref:DUF5682 family protein n=1 Tax=Duganella sp. Root198D2 TaxID=1736489 RepID=UPI00070CAC07|nr:DUF5682 family protein [Duganella sp. Root198D2]KRB97049.1 hypothetical protein ASE26_03150 [Duganella sp. Root198D2]